MSHVKFIPGKYNVVHEGRVVGEAMIDEYGQVTEASLTSEGLKGVLPDYDPTENLSLGAIDPPQYVGDYLPIDINLTESYFREKQKGTFDA